MGAFEWIGLFVSGDVNGDGEVDILDVIITVNFILSGEYNYFADLNSDGAVNVVDIIQIVTIILS